MESSADKHQRRQSGRTTRQLLPLVKAAANGSRTAFVTATHGERVYCMRLVENIIANNQLPKDGETKRNGNRIIFTSTGGSLDFFVHNRRDSLAQFEKERCDFIIADDPLSEEDAKMTPEKREQIMRWYEKTVSRQYNAHDDNYHVQEIEEQQTRENSMPQNANQSEKDRQIRNQIPQNHNQTLRTDENEKTARVHQRCDEQQQFRRNSLLTESSAPVKRENPGDGPGYFGSNSGMKLGYVTRRGKADFKDFE